MAGQRSRSRVVEDRAGGRAEVEGRVEIDRGWRSVLGTCCWAASGSTLARRNDIRARGSPAKRGLLPYYGRLASHPPLAMRRAELSSNASALCLPRKFALPPTGCIAAEVPLRARENTALVFRWGLRRRRIDSTSSPVNLVALLACFAIGTLPPPSPPGCVPLPVPVPVPMPVPDSPAPPFCVVAVQPRAL